MSEQFWVSAYVLFGLCSVIIYENGCFRVFSGWKIRCGCRENEIRFAFFGFPYFCEFFFDLVASVNADMPMISPLTMSMGTAKTIVLL